MGELPRHRASFGYNRVEDASHLLDGPGIVRHLADVVSRGGNLLLNVGPTARGEIPDLQRRSLEQLADWMQVNSAAIHGTHPLSADIAGPSDAPWARWTRAGNIAYAVVDAAGPVRLALRPDAVDTQSACLTDGTAVPVTETGGQFVVEVPQPAVPGPAVLALALRA